MIDPLQMLMQQAADTVSPFAENSRYRYVPTATTTLPDGRQVTYLTRRNVPQPDDLATLAWHVLKCDDRLDRLANQYLNDPELFWRICDGNRALRPDDLSDDLPQTGPPRLIRIALPAGVPAASQPD